MDSSSHQPFDGSDPASEKPTLSPEEEIHTLQTRKEWEPKLVAFRDNRAMRRYPPITGLDPLSRKTINEIATELGLGCYSEGPKDARVVVVTKKWNKCAASTRKEKKFVG